MIDQQMIDNPPHYVKGRKIQPIEAIEGWSLCHHLGCVVKYIARTGRKVPSYHNPFLGQSPLGDLKKAEWYLMREIQGKACQTISTSSLPPMRALGRFAPEAIAKDWELTPALGQVVSNITVYQRLCGRLFLTKVGYLKEALTHLRAEIKNCQEQELARHAALLRDQASGKTNVINFTGGKPCRNYPK
jgi:hypothetical protein